MIRKEFFRDGKIKEGIVVSEEELGSILNVCDYVSISKADVEKLGIKWKTIEDLEKLNRNKIVGTIFGNIDNIFKNIADPEYDIGVVENPDCWFVNKEFLDSNYKDIEKNKFTFGEAVELLKMGYMVAREGWNGKGMFLFLVSGSKFKVSRKPLLGIYPEGTEIEYQPHIDMKTAQGTVVPWLASQSDILAEDWVVTGKVEN